MNHVVFNLSIIASELLNMGMGFGAFCLIMLGLTIWDDYKANPPKKRP